MFLLLAVGPRPPLLPAIVSWREKRLSQTMLLYGAQREPSAGSIRRLRTRHEPPYVRSLPPLVHWQGLELVIRQAVACVEARISMTSKSLWMSIAVAPQAVPLDGNEQCDVVVVEDGDR